MIQVCHDFVALQLRTHEDVEELHAAIAAAERSGT